MQKTGFLVVGSLVMDVIAKIGKAERIDIAGNHVEHLVCVSYGSKSELAGLELHPGGSGSNSAIAIQKLGSPALLLSSVGKDAFGNDILSDLAANGVDTRLVKSSKLMTGVSIVLLSEGGEKSILAYRGASSLLDSKDLSRSDIKGAKRVFIASLVSDSNYRLFEKILRLSREHHKPVIFAPSISMLNKSLPRIKKLNPHFDMMIVNYEEGMYFTGKSEISGIVKALPARVCVVMRDVDGAYASEGRGIFHVPAVPVKIADTTGAGDAFSGVFAQVYYSSGSIQKALKTAASAAAMKLTSRGAYFIHSKKELATFMRKNARHLAVGRI